MADIIERYISKIQQRLDAPDVFIEASAYHLVSSLLGRFFRCSFVPGTPNIGFRPNVWFLLSSIPARTRRSTVLNYHNHVYKRVLCKYLIETIKKTDNERDALEFVDDTIIEEGSPEGIMDHIDVTSKDTFCYTIVSSEFGSVLSNIQNKDYQKGVSTLLSKLYYGESGTVMLSQRKKEQKEFNQKRGRRHIPEGLYCTMIAAMQEPKYYLSPIIIGQGLMRRIVLVYVKSADLSMDKWIPPLDVRTDIYEEFDDIVSEFSDLMDKYYEISQNMRGRHQSVDSIFSTSSTYINNIAKNLDTNLSAEESYYNIYMQGYWEHLTKIAMLHSIARNGINKNEVLDVNIEDAKKANDFLQRATRYSQEVISNLGAIEEPIRTQNLVLERIYTIIKNAGKDGIIESALYRKMNIESRQLDLYTSTLNAQGRIMKGQRQTGGRPAMFWVAVE